MTDACEVKYKGRGRTTEVRKRRSPPKALRVEAAIVDTATSHVVHVCKFNWNNLDERWAFVYRLGDILEQGGFAAAIKPVDPKVERLLGKFGEQ